MQSELSRQDYEVVIALAKQVLDGIVFKHNKNIQHLDAYLIKAVSEGVYIQTQNAFAALAQFSPELVENLIRKVAPKSAAFISIVGFELLESQQDISGLVDAGTVMCLVQIIDHLMDRGDEKMLEALNHYFDDTGTDSDEICARIKILEYLAMVSNRAAGKDAELVTKAALDVLRDEAQVLLMSRDYKNLDNPFWQDVYFRQNAETLADLSIGDVGLRPASYLVYHAYLKAGYDTVSLGEILQSEEIQKATRLGEWAIRLWDDWGDQEIDASENIYTNAYVINLLLERNVYLTEAYLRDIQHSPYYRRAWNIIQEGNEGINYVVICILREEFDKLRATADEGINLYLQIMERIIEAGFVNHAGDEGIAGVKEVVADYSSAT